MAQRFSAAIASGFSMAASAAAVTECFLLIAVDPADTLLHVLDFGFAMLRFSRRAAAVPRSIMRRLIAVGLATLASCLLSACGNTTSSTVPIQVAFTTGFLPPTSVMLNQQCGIAATVTNDPKFGGVNWSCTPASACGAFNPPATASGVPTTYTAPATIPSTNPVTVTATSVSDVNKSISAQVSITQSVSSGCTSP